MEQSGLLEAIVKIYKSGESITPRGDLPELLEIMPDDLKNYCSALLYHKPPLYMALNHWELGLFTEETARSMLRDAGGSAEADTHEHLVGIAMEGGGLMAIAGFSEGNNAVHVYVADTEYSTVKKAAWSLRVWLKERFAESLNKEANDVTNKVVSALVEEMGGYVPSVELKLTVCDREEYNNLDSISDKPAEQLLLAGQHIGFRTSENGVSVAIHNKGVRYLDKKGKRKSKNIPGFQVNAGSISEDGRYVLLLNDIKDEETDKTSSRLTQVFIPDGDLKTYELDQCWPSFAHLRDDHIILGMEGQLILFKISDGELLLRQQLFSIDIDMFPKLLSFYHGRLFVVICPKHYMIGAFKNGEINWIGKETGYISDQAVSGETLYIMKNFMPMRLENHQSFLQF